MEKPTSKAGQAVLILGLLLALGAAAFYWREADTLRDALARAAPPAPGTPLIRGRLDISADESVTVVAIPDSLVPSLSNECVIHTNTRLATTQMRCKNWSGVSSE